MCPGEPPHPDSPQQGGREICPASGGGVAEVEAEAAVADRAVHRIRAVRRTPAVARARADFLRSVEIAGIEWTSGALP